MKLIIFYVAFVLLGELGAYVVGRGVEAWSSGASMPVFLACFFAVFWIAWVAAVKATEPRAA